MGMFCYQCQETTRNTGCTVRGVCGKNEEVAKLQDLLIYTLKGISDIVVKGKIDVSKLEDLNYQALNSLFITITNAHSCHPMLPRCLWRTSVSQAPVQLMTT
ncbi:MAG TPA: hypothetical protein GXZ88_06755 [Firmicutes bacterium]|jgi:hydroxylamine reductase|nr:hypothetical protein [Candidatus Fermentithermobacillaceae bacterium]